MKYIYYQEDSGRILWIASIIDTVTDHPFITAPAEASTGVNFYVENNALVAYPIKTYTGAVFNYTTKQWEDPRTLADLKAAKWTQIKQARAQAEYAGFTWDGSTFDSDATSQNRITGAVTLAQMSAAFSIDWTLADNTVRTLNQGEMLQVGATLGAHVGAQFSYAQSLRTAIEAATTREQVEAVVW